MRLRSSDPPDALATARMDRDHKLHNLQQFVNTTEPTNEFVEQASRLFTNKFHSHLNVHRRDPCATLQPFRTMAEETVRLAERHPPAVNQPFMGPELALVDHVGGLGDVEAQVKMHPSCLLTKLRLP